jgi:probable HAF family extracellular repeat protein
LPPNAYPWTEVADINDLGVATGKHRSADFSTFDGYVWSAGSGSVLLPRLVPNQPLSVLPAAINDAGTVVGMADAGGRAYHAFVWSATNGIHDLNTLVSGLPAGFVLDRALEVNDEGLIVGDGHFGPNWSSSQAFVLIPQDIVSVPQANPGSSVRVVPNPSTGAARFEFVAGAAGRARVSVYDLRGRLVANLASVDVPAGAAVASWDGRDVSGVQSPPGPTSRASRWREASRRGSSRSCAEFDRGGRRIFSRHDDLQCLRLEDDD